MAAKKKKSAAKKKSSAPTKARKPAPKPKKAKKAKKAAPKPKKAKKPAPKASKPKKAKAKPAAAKKKAKAKAKAKPKAKAPAKKTRAPRRDATGHLDPTYARELHERARESREVGLNDRAFLRSSSHSDDDLAEELGEEAVATMTSGEDQSDRLEAEVIEEQGGPFVRTGREEFARGTDKSNPRSATREPFPKT